MSIESIREKLEELFAGLLSDLTGIVANLTMSPDAAFGDEFWQSLLRLGTSAVMPFALTLLCFFMAAEFYQVYCRAIGELDILLVSTTVIKLILPFFLIIHSYDLVRLFYGMFNDLIINMNQQLNLEGGLLDSQATVDAIMQNVEQMGFWERLLYSIELFPLQLGMKIMSIVITVIVYGRLFEIIILWIFSPIPISTFVHHEFGDIGKNYAKMFCALVFQGAIMFLCVVIYAALVKNVTLSTDGSAIWQMLGYSAILVFGLVKTGTLSKRLMGTF